MGELLAPRPWSRAGRYAVVLAAGALIACSSGCGSSGQGKPAAGTPRTTAAATRSDKYAYARSRFRELCAGCHTLADAGATGPRFNLDHDPELQRALVRSIIYGGGPGMPAWGKALSRREFEELSRYVFLVVRRTKGETNWAWQIRLRQEGETHPPILPDRLTVKATSRNEESSTVHQRSVFRSNCGGCHSLVDAHAQGRRAGSEAELDVIRPNRSSIENYLLHQYGKMPSFRNRFTRREIQDLARYVSEVDGCGSRYPTRCANP